MRLVLTLHDSAMGNLTNALVDADPDTALSDLYPRLLATVGADLTGASVAVAVDGVVVDLAASLSELRLVDGSWLTFLADGGTAPSRRYRSGAVVELRVVCGQGAGRTYHCEPGLVTAGIGDGVTMELADSRAKGVEVHFLIDSKGGVIVRPEPTASALPWLGGALVEQPTALLPKQSLVFTDCIVEVALPTGARAALEAEPDTGVINYSRPPRILPPTELTEFRLPMPPSLPQRSRLRLKRTGESDQWSQYRDHRHQIEAAAAVALATEADQRRRNYPDPAELAAIATGPTPQLWQRRSIDQQWLDLRFGTANQASAVRLEDPSASEPERWQQWQLDQAPAAASLVESGSIGLAAPGPAATQLGLWALAQIAVLHSPAEVHVYVLSHQTTGSVTNPWQAVVWLPHTRPAQGQDCLRTVAFSAQDMGIRIAELLAIMDERQKQMTAASVGAWTGTSIVMILDGSNRIRTMPGVVKLLREGPAAGIYSLCLDAEERLLPEECATVVTLQGPTLRISQQRAVSLGQIMPDWVSPDWVDWVFRALAPIQDASPQLVDSTIPNTCRWLELANLDPPRAELIESAWLLAPRSTRTTIGLSLDGPFSLDLASDGPHGLIGGTTGSGKSELLLTMVAGLAVANTPQAMTFVLVDYKGGAAFKDCADLPHTVGLVTDLDTHLVERALTSLNAELKYREQILAKFNAQDIDDYIIRTAHDQTATPLPRLAIVIDEFASLVRELPDFVPGLISIAQRGRSLGLHLVMATQRPSGVISPEIRANTNLRIALRVTDTAESNDIIESTEAAAIPKSAPGRALARLGSSSLVPFQTGSITAPQTRSGAATTTPVVKALQLADLARPVTIDQTNSGGAGPATLTDLQQLVDAIVAANRSAGFAPPRPVYLPPLPLEMTLDQLFEPADGIPQTSQTKPGRIYFGLQDLPAAQSQQPYGIDLANCGHMYIIGSARSGKTTALRSLAVAAGYRHSPADLHMYAIDCGNGGLAALAALPHCGAVVPRTAPDAAQRLITKLLRTVTTRQALLASQGHSSIGEYRAARDTGPVPPEILFLIDSFDGFIGTFESINSGQAVDQVHQLLREGVAAGIHVIASGDEKLLSGRYFSYAADKLVLRLVDRDHYSQIGLRSRSLPDEIPDGRAFQAEGGVETQIALPAPGTFMEQAEAIRAAGHQLGADYCTLPARDRPFSVADMPTRISWEQLNERVSPALGPSGAILLGLGGEDVEPYYFDPLTGPRSFLVTGPPRSGKTNALLAMALAALRSGWEVVAVAPQPSRLADLASLASVTAVYPGPLSDPNRTGTQPIVQAVFHSAEQVTTSAIEPILNQASTLGRSVCLLVDQAATIAAMPADALLRDWLTGPSCRLAVIVADQTDALRTMARPSQTGLLTNLVRRCGQGLLFKPQDSGDGEMIGHGRFALTDLRNQLPLGRAYLHLEANSATVLVQTPLVDYQAKEPSNDRS